MFILEGDVLQVEPVQGTDSSGQAYAYLRAHILSGVEVVRARLGDNFGQLGAGEKVRAEVTVRPYRSRDGADMSVVLVRRLDGVPARAAEGKV
jgi:hypothetical protein